MTRALRRGAPIALASVTALLLAGCAGSAEPEPTPTADSGASAACGEYAAGDASDGVEVTGEFGDPVEATFTTPIEATELERTIAIEGDGETTEPGESVNAVVSIFSGTSGQRVVSQPAPFTVGDANLLEGFTAGVDCVPTGSRTVTVAPAEALWGDTGNEQIGIAPGETVVIVMDVQEPLTPAEWTENQPEVEFNGEEPPTLTLPGTEPSTELEVLVLEEGDGDEVRSGDQVTLDYQGTSWNTGEIFDQSYGGEPATFGTDQVIQGFGAALVGQKVGTQLVVTIPPQFAYGTEQSEGNELGGQTLVFVIEIRDTARG